MALRRIAFIGNSLRLLKQEVMPRLKHLNAELVQAA